MKDKADILARIAEFLYTIYPAIFGQVVFYLYRDHKNKRSFSVRLFFLHLFITVAMGVLTIKGIHIFETMTGQVLIEDVKYFTVFIAGGFSMKLIELLDLHVPQKLENEAKKINSLTKK